MGKMGVTVLAVLLVRSTFCQASDDPPKTGERDRAIAYYRANVSGRTIRSAGSLKSDGGKLDWDHVMTKEFAPPVPTPEGFYFDVVTVIEATKYDVKDGRRAGPGTKSGRSMVSRYEIHESEKTRRLTGFMRNIVNTKHDPIGYAEAVSLKIEGGKLAIESSPLFYDEETVAGGETRLVTTTSRHDFETAEGKLKLKSTSHRFRVDPETLSKAPSGEPPDIFEYDQVDR